jgi:hypothetical protein
MILPIRILNVCIASPYNRFVELPIAGQLGLPHDVLLFVFTYTGKDAPEASPVGYKQKAQSCVDVDYHEDGAVQS